MEKNSDIFIKSKKDEMTSDYKSISTPSDLQTFTKKIKEREEKQYGGARRKSRTQKKEPSKSRGSRRKSRKGSTSKIRRRSLKRSRRGSTKKSKSRSKKGSTRKSRRSTKKIRRTRKMSRSQKRPAGMIAFTDFARFIANEMGEKYGPKIIKLASIYKKQAEKENPGINSIEAIEKAKEIFSNEPSQTRKQKLSEIVIQSGRKSKKTESAYSATSA